MAVARKAFALMLADANRGEGAGTTIALDAAKQVTTPKVHTPPHGLREMLSEIPNSSDKGRDSLGGSIPIVNDFHPLGTRSANDFHPLGVRADDRALCFEGARRATR